jgi:hypothetical protein
MHVAIFMGLVAKNISKGCEIDVDKKLIIEVGKETEKGPKNESIHLFLFLFMVSVLSKRKFV